MDTCCQVEANGVAIAIAFEVAFAFAVAVAGHPLDDFASFLLLVLRPPSLANSQARLWHSIGAGDANYVEALDRDYQVHRFETTTKTLTDSNG